MFNLYSANKIHVHTWHHPSVSNTQCSSYFSIEKLHVGVFMKLQYIIYSKVNTFVNIILIKTFK